MADPSFLFFTKKCSLTDAMGKTKSLAFKIKVRAVTSLTSLQSNSDTKYRIMFNVCRHGPQNARM